MGNTCDLSDFEHGMIVWQAQTGWSEYFRNCWSTGILTHNLYL